VITAAVREVLATKFTALFPHLDERQRRLLLGAEAASLGRGGIAAVALAAGMSVPTVTKGLAEVRAGEPPSGRVRAAGGGRKRLTETDPGLAVALEALVDPETRGDPGSPLRWTTRSTRVLAEALTEAGHPCSHMRVAELLHELGYSLQGNAKQLEGKQHPDRDAQFRHINAVAGRYLRAGDPVVSVDTKKKLRHEVARSE
jgi:transposase